MIRACRIQKRSRLGKKTSEKEYEAVEDRRYEIKYIQLHKRCRFQSQCSAGRDFRSFPCCTEVSSHIAAGERVTDIAEQRVPTRQCYARLKSRYPAAHAAGSAPDTPPAFLSLQLIPPIFQTGSTVDFIV